MTVCEICWQQANEQVAMFGGDLMDRYRKMLALNQVDHNDNVTADPPAATEVTK